MNYMDLCNACHCQANKGIEELIKYLKTNEELLWTESKWNGITTIEVEYWCDDDHIISDMLGIWEFNDKGFLIE